MFSEIILNELETPAICVDKQKLLRNIRLMQGLADSNQVALRPHIKTHKSVEIAQRQIDIGAIGITVATVDEALVFLKENFKSDLYHIPYLKQKIVIIAGKGNKLYNKQRFRP